MGLANRDPLVGLTLDGKYEIVSAIARGGMGRVYRAVQQPLGRNIALKVLDMEQLEGKAAGGDFAKRFFIEAASCAKLTHPNTVVIYDYGRTDDDIFYIAMELLDGPTLDTVLEQAAPIDPATTVHVGLQVCGSIGEAHQQGMVHRDLKPSNVMLINRGADPNFVKVLDFGLVKQEDTGLTQSGALLGTPRYISPEQIANSDVGPGSDIYSLGACLYHCLTGRPPFDSDSKFVLLASHMNVEPPPIEAIQQDTPSSAELREVIMRCLKKDPADRFATMEELAEALMACPEESGTAASSLVSSAVSLSDISAKAARESKLVDRSGVKRSDALTRAESPAAKSIATEPPSKVPVIAAIVIGLVIGIGGIVWWGSRGEEPLEPPVTTEPSVEPEVEPEQSSEPTPMTAGVATRVVVETDPPGAHVRRDGRDLGDSPLNLMIPEGESWDLSISLSGHESREIAVTGGQGSVNVTLERRRRRGMRADPEPEAMVETMVEETPMETPMAVTMEPTMDTTMRPRTDNRDPWAR